MLKVLGAVDTEVFCRLLHGLLAADVADSIALLEEIVTKGRDLGQFVVDFTWYLRNLLLVNAGEDMEDVLEISSEHLAALKEEAAQMEDAVLMRFIRVFSDLSNQLRYASGKRVLIEVALIKLCRPQMEEDYDALVQRVAAMEEKLQQGIPIAAVSPVPAAVSEMQSALKAPEKKALPKAMPEEVAQVAKQWPQILGQTTGFCVRR